MKQALDGVKEMQLNKFEAEILKERAENDKRLIEVSYNKTYRSYKCCFDIT